MSIVLDFNNFHFRGQTNAIFVNVLALNTITLQSQMNLGYKLIKCFALINVNETF